MPDGELPFSHEYAKHDRAVFPTIRRRDKFGDVGETVEVTADDEKLGDAEIVAKETVRFGDLPTWLLCYDCEISPDGENSNRDKDLRAAAHDSLSGFYRNSIGMDEPLTMYWLRWVGDSDQQEPVTDGGVDAETPAELVELWRRRADNYPAGELGVAARAAVEACADELDAVLTERGGGSMDGDEQDSLYAGLYEKVYTLRNAGLEPDRIVVPAEDWREVKNQAEVLEGEGVAGSDKTLVNGVLVTYNPQQSCARVIHEVDRSEGANTDRGPVTDGGMPEHVTHIEGFGDDGGFYRCDECGATGETVDAIDHREDCPSEESDDTDDWDPEPAELREGETRDDRSHAARNAEQLEMADDTGGDESDG